MKYINLPVQVNPSPVNPVLHSHMYDPLPSVQVALSWHPSVPRSHSLMSMSKMRDMGKK